VLTPPTQARGFRSTESATIREIYGKTNIDLDSYTLSFGDCTDLVISVPTTYPGERQHNLLVRALTRLLYREIYVRATPRPPHATAEDFQMSFQAANTSRQRWSGNWSLIEKDEKGEALFRGASRLRLADADHYRAGRGASFQLLNEPESTTSQDRFYFAFGERLGDRYEDLVGARLYLALAPDSASAWVAEVTRSLNAYAIPFAFKALRYRQDYGRSDAGVLYVPRLYAGFAAAVLTRLTTDLGGLGRSEPFFTRPLRPGLSIADNPPGGESFGMHRMGLLAAAIVCAKVKGIQEPEEAVAEASVAFAMHGLDASRPWLNPGNSDFVISFKTAAAIRMPGAPAASPFHDAAETLGRRLVRDAIRSAGLCCWIGWHVAPTRLGYRPAVCASARDIYSGTAGIALFLGRLGAATGDRLTIETAVAAMRHATRSDWPAAEGVGAYAGLGGVLYAEAHLSKLLKSDELASVAEALLTAADGRRGDLDFDLLSGKAGLVRALLSLPAEFSPLRCLDLAEDLGDQLIGAALEEEGGLSWPSPVAISDRPLCGYAHGTAGIAASLTLLAARTGRERFSSAAARAMRFEVRQFDEGAANWPDYRRNSLADAPADNSGPVRRFMIAWCNGAPGGALALSRLNEPLFRGQLTDAIDTTRRSLRADLEAELADCSLCHGLLGKAAILNEIGETLGRIELSEEARAAGEEALAHYGDGHWPGGIDPQRECQGFMLGNAGIGHFYLTLAEPGMPSPLEL